MFSGQLRFLLKLGNQGPKKYRKQQIFWGSLTNFVDFICLLHFWSPKTCSKWDPLIQGADWNNACKIKLKKFFRSKYIFLRLKIMCLRVSCKFFFFVSLKSLKKGVGSGVGSVPSARIPGTDPRIQIWNRTKMSRIPNTGFYNNIIAHNPFSLIWNHTE